MKDKKVIKKRVLGIVSAMLVALSLSCMVFSVDTYAASPKSQVKTTVNKLMKGIKKCNDKNVEACLPKGMKAGYNSNKLSMPGLYGYMKKANSKLSYKILKTTVKGSKATVKVKVKYVDATEFMENFIRAFGAAEATGEIKTSSGEAAEGSMSMEEAMAEIAKILKATDNCMAKASAKSTLKKTRTETITLKLKKSGKSWRLVSVNDKLSNIMQADINRVQTKIAKDENRVKQLKAEGAAEAAADSTPNSGADSTPNSGTDSTPNSGTDNTPNSADNTPNSGTDNSPSSATDGMNQ